MLPCYHTLSFRLLFLRDIPILFELAIFPLFPRNAYTKMCVSTLGSFQVFGKKVKIHGKSQVKPWFLRISLISVFSLYFNNFSLITFPTPPPGPTAAAVALTVRTPQAPRRADPGPHGAGGPRPSRCGRPQAPRRAALGNQVSIGNQQAIGNVYMALGH